MTIAQIAALVLSSVEAIVTYGKRAVEDAKSGIHITPEMLRDEIANIVKAQDAQRAIEWQIVKNGQ